MTYKRGGYNEPPQRPNTHQNPNLNPNIRCPKCNSPMIKRVAKFHKESDSPFFWGCSNYPNCKQTRIYSPDDEQPATNVEQKIVQPVQPKVEVPKPNIVVPKVVAPVVVPKVAGLIPGSPEQEAIWYFMLNGTAHGQINSVAGSGKSFTIVQGGLRQKLSKLRIFVIAFNKHIEVEMNGKLRENNITWMIAKTYHSLGNTGVRKQYPNAKLDSGKLKKIIKEFLKQEEPVAIGNGVAKLVALCKNYLLNGRDRDQVLEIANHHTVDIDEEHLDRVLQLVPIVLQECLRRKATFDFDDMIWWPVVERLAVDQCDELLVDEAQDTNKVQQELIFLACPKGRIFVVGDSYQAIYGFRGADTSAMDSLYERLASTQRGCEKYKLTVTRRCPKSHVKLAQAIMPEIQALPDAPEGTIDVMHLSKAQEEMKPGDLVLCRVNAALVPVCYALLKRGIKAQIKGRDIGQGLINLINSFKANNIPDLLTELKEYEDREMAKLARMEEKAEGMIQALQDKVETLVFLCEGINSIKELIDKIESIFADLDEAGQRKEAVVLGTVHRTKGLESHTVFIIKPDLIPHPAAKNQWQQDQERNLAYVAVTRSKYEKGVSDGRLVFCGFVPAIYNYEQGEAYE